MAKIPQQQMAALSDPLGSPLMIYRVTCADRNTGKPYTVDVEAERPRQAVSIAAAAGHLASTAEVVSSAQVLRAAPAANVHIAVNSAAQAAHNAAMLEEARLARVAAEKHHKFSIVRVICLFILLGGLFLLIPFCMAIAGGR